MEAASRRLPRDQRLRSDIVLAPSEQQSGTLVLVATPIGNLADLSRRAAAALAEADAIYCEDTRHTGRLLQHAGIKANRLVSLHAHNEAERTTGAIEKLRSGETIVLVSDAGTPLVSDPGSRLVVAAIAAGAKVSVVPGPTAAIAALVLSGFELDRWRFEGFLPRKGLRRKELLEEIAAAAHVSVLYESPRRLSATLGELVEVCGADRQVVLARELTKLHEQVWRGSLSAALLQVGAVEPRGEYVIVVAGKPAEPPSESGELRDGLRRLLAAGLARRDAVVAAQVLLGVSHNEAYRLSLDLEGPPSTSS